MYSITELNTNPIFKPPTFLLEGIKDDDFLAYKYIKKNLHTSKSYYKQPRQIQLLLDFYLHYVTNGDPNDRFEYSKPEFKFYWKYREGTQTEFIAGWDQQPDETSVVCGTRRQDIARHNKNIKETLLENVATIDYFQEILQDEYDNLDFLY